MTGKSPVVREFPMVPGIDMAGVVEASSSDGRRVGDRVLLDGWRVGEGHWGGFSQGARVKAEWLQRVPESFTIRQAMAIGTAGYTARLCVDALLRHGLTPDQGDVLVTGASGGVGSVMTPTAPRQLAWERLARDLDASALDRISKTVVLAEAIGAAPYIVAGTIRGRVVVDVNR